MSSAGPPEPPLIRPMPADRGRFDRRRRLWRVDTATRIEIIALADCRNDQRQALRGCQCSCHRGVNPREALEIYFTTDGTEPNPVNRWETFGQNGHRSRREVTFRYEGPFCLNAGKRVVRAVTVVGGCRRRRHCDGLNCSATEVAEFRCRPWRYDKASAARSAQSDLLSGATSDSSSRSSSSSDSSSDSSESEIEQNETHREEAILASSAQEANTEPSAKLLASPSSPSSTTSTRSMKLRGKVGGAVARCCCGGTQINVFGGGKWSLQPVKDEAEINKAEKPPKQEQPQQVSSVLQAPPPVPEATGATEDTNEAQLSKSAGETEPPSPAPSPSPSPSRRDSVVVPDTAQEEESAMPEGDPRSAEGRSRRYLSLAGPETLDINSPVRTIMEDSEQPPATMGELTEQLLGMVEESKREQSGTLEPVADFRPAEDAETIQQALNESPVAEHTVIDIITRRVAWQRAAISAAFAAINPDGQRLSEKFPVFGAAADASDFNKLCGLLCLGPAEFDACQLRQALDSPQADEACLIEILCSRTQSKIEAAKTAYQHMYGRSFAEDALDGIGGPFRALLDGLAGRSRPEGAVYDRDQARRDGRALAEEGPAGWAAGGGCLAELLAERSNAHLRAAFAECQKLLCGTSDAGGGIANLEAMVKLRVPAGGGRKRLLTLLRCLCDRPAYFANLLNKAVHGAYRDDRVVLRVIISRCEIDMVQIKQAFQAVHGDPLAGCLRGFAGGIYLRGLLQLIGED